MNSGEWCKLTAEGKRRDLDTISAVMSMIDSAIMIEDYSDFDVNGMYGELVDDEILNADRETVRVSVFVPSERNPAEALSFLRDRFSCLGTDVSLSASDIKEEDWEELADCLEMEGMTREAQYVRTAKIAEAIKELPEKLPCQYSAGESRLHPLEPCNYILVDVSPLRDELDGETELYAELPPDDKDETATYQPLKEAICDQLDAYGLPHYIVNWPYQD